MNAGSSSSNTSPQILDATAAASLPQSMFTRSSRAQGAGRFSIRQTSQPSADLVTPTSQPIQEKPPKKAGSELHGTTDGDVRRTTSEAMRFVRDGDNRVEGRTGAVRVPGMRFGFRGIGKSEPVERCTGCGSWIYKSNPCRTCDLMRGDRQ